LMFILFRAVQDSSMSAVEAMIKPVPTFRRSGMDMLVNAPRSSTLPCMLSSLSHVRLSSPALPSSVKFPGISFTANTSTFSNAAFCVIATAPCIVSHGRLTPSRFALEEMFTNVDTGHFSQSRLSSPVLMTLAMLLGPSPKLQFSSAGRSSRCRLPKLFSAEKLRVARFDRPSSSIVSIDSREDEDIECSAFADEACSVARDFGPLSWMSCGAEAEIVTRAVTVVHLLRAATSAWEAMVRPLGSLQSGVTFCQLPCLRCDGLDTVPGQKV
jgi:hypothetical protein